MHMAFEVTVQTVNVDSRCHTSMFSHIKNLNSNSYFLIITQRTTDVSI